MKQKRLNGFPLSDINKYKWTRGQLKSLKQHLSYTDTIFDNYTKCRRNELKIREA